VKFKVDENLPEEVTQLLRDAGWDALSVVDQKMGGEDDPTLARVCEAEDRILVTFDRGFTDIRTYPPTIGPGMIVLRLKRQDKPAVLTVAARVIQTLMHRDLKNELWIVHDNRIRIRSV